MDGGGDFDSGSGSDNGEGNDGSDDNVVVMKADLMVLEVMLMVAVAVW